MLKNLKFQFSFCLKICIFHFSFLFLRLYGYEHKFKITKVQVITSFNYVRRVIEPSQRIKEHEHTHMSYVV